MTNDGSFGAYMKGLREKKGLTMRKLAEISMVSPGYISQIESGDRTPSPDVLRKLADPLEADYYDLLLKSGHIVAEDKTKWEKETSHLLADFTESELQMIKQALKNEIADLKPFIQKHEQNLQEVLRRNLQGLNKTDTQYIITEKEIRYIYEQVEKANKEELEKLELLLKKINYRLHPTWGGEDPEDYEEDYDLF